MSDQQVCLRPITEADLPEFVRWLNDPEVTAFAISEFTGITLESEREWLARKTAPESRDRPFAIEVDGRLIGMCELELLGEESGTTGCYSIAIGDKTAWNRGYGTAATREACAFGFEEMGLQRIWLHVGSHNPRGIRCYEKVGFRHEGVMRRAKLKRGQWIDVVVMAILREEWEEINREPEEGGIRISAFHLGDYEQVMALWRAVGFQGWSLLTREQVARKLSRDPDLFLVACVAGQVIGTVMGSWDGYRGWAHNVAVHPSYQRRGIGRSLMSELENRLWHKGARVLNLHYLNESTWARDFYHSLGFQDASSATTTQKVLKEPSP
jgi:RimJ/RimL family protein N-acetyltransferase